MFSSKYYGYTCTMISALPNHIESMINKPRLDRSTFMIPTIITRIPMNSQKNTYSTEKISTLLKLTKKVS